MTYTKINPKVTAPQRGCFLVFTKDIQDESDPFHITVGYKYKVVDVVHISRDEMDFKYINDAGKLDYISTSSIHFNTVEFYTQD